MIRVNLLPRKKGPRAASAASSEGQGWLVALFIVLMVQVAGSFGFHTWYSGKVTDQKRRNAELSAQLERSRQTVANHGEVKKKLAELRAREEAISALQSGRTGPTAVLFELARILTPGRGPTVDPAHLDTLRRENPLAMFSPGWDARRLWISGFKEEAREVTIQGLARDGEDVSEFARRLNLSGSFSDVRLEPGHRSHDANTGIDTVEFQLRAKVRY